MKVPHSKSVSGLLTTETSRHHLPQGVHLGPPPKKHLPHLTKPPNDLQKQATGTCSCRTRLAASGLQKLGGQTTRASHRKTAARDGLEEHLRAGQETLDRAHAWADRTGTPTAGSSSEEEDPQGTAGPIEH